MKRQSNESRWLKKSNWKRLENDRLLVTEINAPSTDIRSLTFTERYARELCEKFAFYDLGNGSRINGTINPASVDQVIKCKFVTSHVRRS